MLSERRTRDLRDLANRAASVESIDEAGGAVLRALADCGPDVPWVTLHRCLPGTDQLQLFGSTGVSANSPALVDATTLDAAPWPLRAVLESGQAALVADVVGRVGNIPCGAYPEATTHAFVLPIKTSNLGPPFGFAVVGLSTRLALDDAYRGFVELVGEAIATPLRNALAYEREKRKADELTALDEAKTVFFSNVSHEFRTPLTLMLGPLEDVLNDVERPLDPRSRQELELTHRNAQRLLKLVNTLLDFSRIQAGRIEASYRPTQLGRLTADLASVFRAAIEKAGIGFRVEMADLGDPVFVDHAMWEKIVLNLLSNAFKFTFQGEIVVELARVGDRACLTVRDTGAGIPAEEIPNLFRRFHRVERTRGRTFEGSGIGLALIDELVKLHGGSISVVSDEGSGSTFAVSLPFGSRHLPAESVVVSDAAVAPSPLPSILLAEAERWLPDPSPVLPPDGTAHTDEPTTSTVHKTTRGAHAMSRRVRILIADDNADMRSYLQRLVAALGDVEVVGDGEVALAAIGRQRPDLVIGDIMMPRLDGFGVLERLRGDPTTADIPFVLLSARAGEESRIQGLRLGADDFLLKPFSAGELLARATAQLKLGEARRATETERRRLHEFFMQAPIPMVILQGPEHRFVLANAPYEVLIGQKAVGKTVLELFPRDEAEAFIPLLDDVYTTGRPLLGKELPFQARGRPESEQERRLDVSYHPFRESSGEITGLLAIVIDVTDQVRARRIIEDAMAQLTDERLRREQFVVALSHDLRTPLNAAQIGSRLLQQQLDDAPTVARVAGLIVRNIERADSMVRDLLDANRLRPGERMPLVAIDCCLDEVLAAIARGLDPAHGGELTLVNEAGTVPGRWDPKALRRVVENLTGNAVKYGRRGGAIDLRLTRGDDWVELAVHNEGDVIPAADLASVFRAFHRTASAVNSREQGWGVGLALVKGVAEAHGGSTRVESEAAAGTTFFVRFPIAGQPAELRSQQDQQS